MNDLSVVDLESRRDALLELLASLTESEQEDVLRMFIAACPSAWHIVQRFLPALLDGPDPAG